MHVIDDQSSTSGISFKVQEKIYKEREFLVQTQILLVLWSLAKFARNVSHGNPILPPFLR